MSSQARAEPAVSANRRIVARFIDTWVLGFLGSFAVVFLWSAVGRPISQELLDNKAFGSWLAVLSMILLDVPCTKLWGRTPGKTLLSLRVVSSDGSPLTWGQAWQRSGLVWLRGLALGIPLLWLITSAIAMRRVNNTGVASWDEASRTRVVRATAV